MQKIPLRFPPCKFFFFGLPRWVHFLNQLNKIIDLKSAPKGRVKNIQHCKGRVKRKKITEKKTKLVHIARDINLFTH
jgi:hypothetical protein